jgi:putative transposase
MTTRYNPKRHHRRSIRLPGYDYRQPGAYFVTICTYQGEPLFDDPVLKRVAETLWQRIPRHFPHVQLDAWVVMPNHLHGILILTGNPSPSAPPPEPDPTCRGEASPESPSSTNQTPFAGTHSIDQPLPRDASPLQDHPTGTPPGSLGTIVANFKSLTARRINRLRRTPSAPVWQRNYYEHVVRHERALNAIRQYIAANPARWAWDTYNPLAAGPDPQAVELWRILQEQGPQA